MRPTWLCSKRGVRTKTAYTRYVVDFISDLRGMAVEEIAQATYDNAKSLFGLSDLVEQEWTIVWYTE